ncbi:D-alanyl-D-alanine carboxypeptidase family protein [Paenibacillus glycanilyticus]|uniref:D-alanyl-D-alanine carboxypeptidase family protein n=1 Tax=Paenibacillus glycanilyticus TaxID=126569 RepID=UPI00203D3B17|nr:D-alanyl-D-alanine carboxypeptidase family protein [Paenibacillus glycanilyticus]MCM3631060.1 D-alanyl-D-alanine carboxypeptidase family protein [Paenibacillus glycanilyticus]
MGQTNLAKRNQSGRHITFKTIKLANSEIYQGQLVLINPENPIRQALSPGSLMPLSSIPAIHTLRDGMLLERTCLRQLAELLEASQGINDIVAVSGYRTKQEQEHIYASTLAERGAEYTACYVALPDRSEHQSGLAIDVGKLSKDVDYIAPAFPDTETYKAFKQLAASFGFIQRYKEGKEAITQISCEPWHFRYVGYPHADIMERNDWCLEEYIDALKSYTHDNDHLLFEDDRSFVEVYYVAAEAGASTTIPLVLCDRYILSGNNKDGFIVTAYWDKSRRAHV